MSELKITRVRKKRGRIITVFGKRWFDKRWGNTYFSVVVLVDGIFKGKQPYEYGYGDQYLQRALEILQGVGVYPKVEHEALWHLAELHGDKFNYFVADVASKKDL